MADTQKLRKLVSNFTFYSHPSDGVGSNPCTVNDINNVINNLGKVLNAFIDELEKPE